MNNNGKLRCGVIGVGFLGQHHARIYSQLEHTQLVGVFDSNSERAREIAEAAPEKKAAGRKRTYAKRK